MGRQFWMSFQPVLVIHVVDTKSKSVTTIPFEVVQQGPRKVSLHVYPIPVYTKEELQIN
jgi:hypothetical protein